VRRESAAETSSQLVLPLFAVLATIGAMVLFALRRGLAPLGATSEALALRSADSLTPLDLREVPLELLPLVQTMNDLLHRLAMAFAAQRNFVADAAHELRSPVTALQLQVQVLERSRDPNERAEAAADLAAGIARARRLIEQLLYLSRAAADDSTGALFTRQTVPLDDLVRSVVTRWSAEAQRRGIDLGAEAGASVCVEGDPLQLETLLGNLVENALRYTPAGGIVDVVSARLDGAPTLRVIDTGPGIPAAERERVFDRFYRSPDAMASAEVGSGLGLAIVKVIADRHRAVVTLHHGRQATGLEVRVALPPRPA
jgi:two-component system, OmpR family, sensor kinase